MCPMSISLDEARAEFAESIRRLAGLRSEALVRAFGAVRREDFVGPGPWKILVLPDVLTYRDTPDADPRHLYANVLVALDPSRFLNNGEPAALARWLDALDLKAGERFLHVGCGVGYYTAIAAEVVSRSGRVLAVEVDPILAERARNNLGRYDHATVVRGDGMDLAPAAFDAIFVNAGATHVPPTWVAALRPGGRLLAPLTVDVPGMDVGLGQMLLVTQVPGGYDARFVSPVGVYHCAGARTAEGESSLRRAYAGGDEQTVRQLRLDDHPSDERCWLHSPSYCLSRQVVAASPA
jgi:protein-L-isoaspartate(D-aspartate) O-methyltransferase